MRSKIRDLAKALGWWLVFSVATLVAYWSKMEWNSFLWVGILSLLGAANFFFITMRYFEDDGPSIKATTVALLIGVFMGVISNHGLLQAVGAVIFVAATTVGFWVVGFIGMMVVAAATEEAPAPSGGY